MFIVTKQIDRDNISKLCRTCLREDGEKMLCLFVGPAGSSLAAKLRSLSCLEVWQGDGLPERLCDRCVTRAESALLFREQCRAADKALRQAASQVSGLTKYTTVPDCKLYEQKQEEFTSIEHTQKTLKCVECGAAFINYQELCAHRRLHAPIQESSSMQHMHIVESNNTYFTTDSSISGSVVGNKQSLSDPMKKDRPACALYCSLCNHTFPNRNQLISHNFSHCNDSVIDNSCKDSIEIDEDSRSEVAENLTFHRSVELTNSITFPENLAMSSQPPEPEDSTLQPESIINSNLNPPSMLRFPPFLDSRIPQVSISSSQEKKHKCPTCGKLFSQKSKLITHKFSHTGQRPFQCNNCEKAYTSKSKLTAHMRLHTRTNVHECKICDKIFSYPSYLTEHEKIHNNNEKKENPKLDVRIKEFECSICKKQYRLKKNLIAHLRQHGTGKSLFYCEICDKSFSQKYNLKVHLRLHKGNKLHKCEFCSKSFAEKGNYTEHLRIHTKVKPFSCKICGKSFSQSSHLKSHIVTHNSIRSHQCTLCGKTFKLLAHLKRHTNLHSSVKPFKCLQCNQLFSQAFSLKRHLKKHSEG